MKEISDAVPGLSKRLADAALARHVRVACAESLTGGQISSALAQGPRAAEWFAGSVVAYSASVKHDLLQVPEGPVVTQSAVATMAERVAELLGADLTVAVSGSGGPEPQDGQPPGVVWFAIHHDGRSFSERRLFEDEPREVVEQSVVHALRMLLDALGSDFA